MLQTADCPNSALSERSANKLILKALSRFVRVYVSQVSPVRNRLKTTFSVSTRVSNRNSVAYYVAERNAIFTAISARFVAHVPLPLAPNLRLKVFSLAHQQCGILGAIKV